MNLTDEEKQELLEWLDEIKVVFSGNTIRWTLKDIKMENQIRALIEAPPPKHIMCESCLDDLEDYVWVYCDKCWQKLLDDWKAAVADLKKVGPKKQEEK